MPEPRRSRSNVFGALSAGGIVVLFCLVLLWHDPLLFWNDDYELSILPVFADVARSWSEGSLPLLSPYSWVCGNLAGEFQYGTFSVFVNAAVVLIWKLPLTFPQQAAALSTVHLFVLAMGGYMLARGRDLSAATSTMVALIAALNGWIICWGATDWFGALGAFAWLPWAWWGMERAIDPARGKWRFLWPAPFVYLVITGGFPYTVLMLGLIAAWLAIKSLGQTRRPLSILPLLVGGLLGVGLAAPAWLALLDYARDSARVAQDSAEHFQWRVPAAALPGLILPSWTVTWTDFSSRFRPHIATELAGGFVPLVALFAGLVAMPRAFLRKAGWELGLLLVVLCLCMLPTAGMFRWSFRWLPLLHLVLALAGAEALRFSAESRPGIPKLRAVLALILAVSSIGAAFMFGANGEHSFPFLWIAAAVTATWALLELFTTGRVRGWLPAGTTFAFLLATYLSIPTNCGVPKYNLAQEMTKAAPLDPERLYLSIYPAPEYTYRAEEKPAPFGTTIRPGSTSMWAGIRLLNGYSPIRPAGVAREFAASIHGNIDEGAASLLVYSQSGSDGLLEVLGVDGIIIANEIGTSPYPPSEWQLAATTDEGHVYHRQGAPLAALRSLSTIDSRPNEQFSLATISGINATRQGLQADVRVPAGSESALLALSRPFFRGYRAVIGERALPVSSYRGLMPLVEVPAGMAGRLTLVYRPSWLVWGGTIAIASLLLVLGSAAAAGLTTRRRA
ncbi:MAG: hypothetical protein ACJ8M4_04570 [Chthoniobacterales bacterium]